MGTVYALKVQKKMTMMRARAFVRGTYSKVEDTFKTEALILLEQNDKLKSELERKEKEFDKILRLNRELEIDLAVATK